MGVERSDARDLVDWNDIYQSLAMFVNTHGKALGRPILGVSGMAEMEREACHPRSGWRVSIADVGRQ